MPAPPGASPSQVLAGTTAARQERESTLPPNGESPPDAQRRPAGELRAADVVLRGGRGDKRIVRPTTAENLLRHALASGDVGTARLVASLIEPVQ